MQTAISIKTDICTRCTKCVKVCPSKIFVQPAATDQHATGGLMPIELVGVEGCIKCGHCVAVCPVDAIDHSLFPAQTVHPIDYLQMPTPEQTLLLCRARRSNRAFTSKPVPMPMLDMILEAAHRAPTASNMQQVEFTLITDAAQLKHISDFTVDVFRSVARKLKNPLLRPALRMLMPGLYRYLPVFDRLIEQRSLGHDLILRGATAVIFIHTPSDSRFGCQDANLAYQNGSLMAESLGVSQFYTGFVCNAIKQSDKLVHSLGIKGTIHAGMALGMPAFRYPKYIDKQPIKVTKV